MRHHSASSGFTPPRAGESAATIARILARQGLVGVGTAAAVWMLQGSAAGFSALLGALVCVLPGVAFGAWIALGLLSGGGPRMQLHTFYFGEALKLAFTVVLFTVVFKTVEVLDPLFLFTGFIVTQLTMIWVLLRG